MQMIMLPTGIECSYPIVEGGPSDAIGWKRHGTTRIAVPVLGYTWFSLTDQVDWDIQLREIRNNAVPNGLFTLDRQPRPARSATCANTTAHCRCSKICRSACN